MSEAFRIYQDHLDRLSRAFWDLDIDTMLDMLTLPNRMITQDAKILLDTPDALLKAVTDFRDFLHRAGAQEFHRIALNADFHPDNPECIEGYHNTYVMRGGQYVVEPYKSKQVLVLENGAWRGFENHSDVKNSAYTIISPTQLRERALAQDAKDT